MNVPVMTFDTETDAVFPDYLKARQPDTDRFRAWEVAGYRARRFTIDTGRNDAVGNPVFASIVEENSVLGCIACDKSMNNGPHH